MKSIVLLSCGLVWGVGSSTLAQAASAPVDCSAQFAVLDVDGDGELSEAEAPQVFARARIDETQIPDAGYTRDEFLSACSSNAFVTAEPEQGAPFEGANSFTEAQARDRALARGVSRVSALTKDDLGIWRGTGMVLGAPVSVAIDFKGNVVTAP